MNFENFKERYQNAEIEHFPHLVVDSPLVSVLVQTYNHGSFISNCLDGILKQITNFDYEILLGEDASQDGTREICIEYARKYPGKIQLFLHHPDNKIKVLNATTGNFNALYNFHSAKGEFIAFCEGDDFWTDPLKLQKQVDLLKSNSALALTYHNYTEVNEKGKALPEDIILEQPTRDLSEEDLKKLTFHPLLSTVCFRNCIKGDIPYELAEVINVDSFLLSLLGNYGKGAYQEDILHSIYRRHLGGIWGRKLKKAKLQSKLLTYKKIKKFYIQSGNHSLAQFYNFKIRNVYKMLIYNRIIQLNFIKKLCTGKN